MGSDVHLVLVGGSPEALAGAVHRIEQLESRWSRFRPDSEVSALNNSAGRPVAVSTDTRLLVERATEAWRLTGGAFDPTVLTDLLRAGYDRSFEQLSANHFETRDGSRRNRSIDAPACTDIVVDGQAVTVPAGLGFDAGGIGKGLAADLVASELIGEGVAGVCVNIGGDLRVLGDSPCGDGWTLAIEHPLAATPIALVGLVEGAVATSSVLRRVWNRGGKQRHHLIDPSTGEPSESDVALASVIAGQAWQAEALAKAALLRGRARAFDLLDSSCASVIVDHAGIITGSDAFSTFLGSAALPASVELDHRRQP